ncbi:MAG: hypothetical protein IJK96_03440 [Bacteroidales bacterium]|nr:hypothetical protein [Bacteroidales bacterium]
MKLHSALLLPALLLCISATGQERLRRDQSFLGVHMDFHAGPENKDIGANTTPEMVQALLDMIHPDYIQVDCKGHPGYSSYPTEVGNRAPGVTGDPLKVWREVTARNGVALYMHYSGVWDSRAVQLHPGWAAIDKDGKPSENMTSMFGPYVDSLLIPQLKELAGKYGVDGVWVDGECWAPSADYCEKALKMFREQTGADAPRSPEEPLWLEWKQFNREAFRRYLRHYIAAVRSEYPDFQICSNWAFTPHMSEPVSAPVDFLSGDYNPSNSVNSARVAARYLANQGLPWDLMAWSFVREGWEQKPAVQLIREAAVTLSQGGGFQAYYTQNPDGSANLAKMESMAAVAEFARARQAFCHHSVAVPQVALVQSTYNFQRYDRPESPQDLFPYYTGSVGGILYCLLESQYSVDLLGEASLSPDMSRYPLVVIPECNALSSVFKDELLDYAGKGGSLLVAGEGMSKFFSEAAGIGLLGNRWFTTAYGKGRIGFIPTGIAIDYEEGRNVEAIRSGLKKIVGELFPEPVAKVKSSPYVDVSVRKHDGKLQVHLVNTSGDHKNSPIQKEIAPVKDIEISLAVPEKPERIVFQPEGKDLPFKYKDGRAVFEVPVLEIYEIVEVE